MTPEEKNLDINDDNMIFPTQFTIIRFGGTD